MGGGEKGRGECGPCSSRVQTKETDGRVGPSERLGGHQVVRRQPVEVWYTLSNASSEVPLAPVAVAHGRRHGVEELFQEGNQEVGLSHYEVRSWTGWRHHMTLSLVALWFLQLERLRVGEKKSGNHGVVGAFDVHGVAALPVSEGV